ncbi:MAG: FtsL-like putative cell division protein [Phycisphaerales bacterium]|nr:FtsL-like putative cell division protein [Phycisphaerales bacterium]
MTKIHDTATTNTSDTNQGTPAPHAYSFVRSIKVLFRFLKFQWVFNNVFFILFICVLLILHIAAAHLYDAQLRNINMTTHNIEELSYEYKMLQTEIVDRILQKQVITVESKQGLSFTSVPPFLLKMEKYPSGNQ